MWGEETEAAPDKQVGQWRGEGQAAQEAEPVGARPGPAWAEEGVASTQRPACQDTSCPRLGKACQRGPQNKLLLSESLQVGQPLGRGSFQDA